jgi:hypothetical protein
MTKLQDVPVLSAVPAGGYVLVTAPYSDPLSDFAKVPASALGGGGPGGGFTPGGTTSQLLDGTGLNVTVGTGLTLNTTTHTLTAAGGGPALPGGTTGQVQFNSAGTALGGFTVGGDGTLNTATGALTVTKTAGIAFGAAATAGYGPAPGMNGTAAAGSATTVSRSDHVHPTDTSRAPLASPTFTGVPAAPTAGAGTNTTQLATTQFVTTAVSGVSGSGSGTVASSTIGQVALYTGATTVTGSPAITFAGNVVTITGSTAINLVTPTLQQNGSALVGGTGTDASTLTAANSSATPTLTFSSAIESAVYDVTLNSNWAPTLAGTVAGKYRRILLTIRGGAGGFTFTMPTATPGAGTVVWSGGAGSPVINTAAGALNRIWFESTDAGVTVLAGY